MGSRQERILESSVWGSNSAPLLKRVPVEKAQRNAIAQLGGAIELWEPHIGIELRGDARQQTPVEHISVVFTQDSTMHKEENE